MRTWNELSMAERADVMKLAIDGGVYDLDAIRDGYNKFASGGSIHIKPENRGKFTALKERTGHSATWFKQHGTPAQKKMAVFALNSRKWKHEDGGEIISDYQDNDTQNNAMESIINMGNTLTGPSFLHPAYRNRSAEKDSDLLVPLRIRDNSSPTKESSMGIENQMRRRVVKHQALSGGSNPDYDIPYIPEKAILLGGSTTSTNALDTLTKYAAIHNANPQLSDKPVLQRSKYAKPRQINKDEMLGLAYQETRNGAWPYMNTDGSSRDRELLNSNYFTAFGYIPADNFIRNFHYNKAGIDRSVPPVLDGFRYFAQGDYNRGDKNHISDVNNAGKEAWKNKDVIKWWNTSDPNSGKNLYDYWYNKTKRELRR